MEAHLSSAATYWDNNSGTTKDLNENGKLDPSIQKDGSDTKKTLQSKIVKAIED